MIKSKEFLEGVFREIYKTEVDRSDKLDGQIASPGSL